ncbi:MAG: type IV pilus modification PilV family protein [Myxococcota bacterium]
MKINDCYRDKTISKQRGMTLIEIMVSLSVLFVGILTLFKVVTVSSSTSLISRQISTAVSKAQDHMEALKEVPDQTLICLSSGGSPAGCLSSCTSNGGDLEHCQLSLGLLPDQNSDGHGVTFTPSFGVTLGTLPNTYEVEVVSSWQGDESPPRTHRIYLKTTVYR